MSIEKDIHKLKEKFLTEDAIVPHSRRKKKHRSPPEDQRHCPFCKVEIPLDKNSKEYKAVLKSRWTFFWGVPRLDECICGAIRVKDCPACHRETWYKDKIFKHCKGWLGCGFVGQRKNV